MAIRCHVWSSEHLGSEVPNDKPSEGEAGVGGGTQGEGMAWGGGAARVQAGCAQELGLNLRTVCVGVYDGFGFGLSVHVFVWFALGRRGRNLAYEFSLIVFPYT